MLGIIRRKVYIQFDPKSFLCHWLFANLGCVCDYIFSLYNYVYMRVCICVCTNKNVHSAPSSLKKEAEEVSEIWHFG
jgi:hypothetical protein